MLIGAYFTQEYSLESAALFNPSMVLHPDQSDLPSGSVRFIMSLRAVGEGHVSSIVFRQGEITEDGKLSWLEVECLGACVNAPMVQINDDFYEDLTAEKFEQILNDLRQGNEVATGPQNSRRASEPEGGLTVLKGDT